MFPEDKLDTIRVYLKAKFTDPELADWEDLDRIGWTFRLRTCDKTCLITASSDFVTRRSADEIQHMLTDGDLARYLHHDSVRHVTIMPNSFVIES